MISSSVFAKLVKQIKMLGLLAVFLGAVMIAETSFSRQPAPGWIQCNAACDVANCTIAPANNCGAFAIQCRGDKQPGGAWPPGCALCTCTNAQFIIWCICSEPAPPGPGM